MNLCLLNTNTPWQITNVLNGHCFGLDIQLCFLIYHNSVNTLHAHLLLLFDFFHSKNFKTSLDQLMLC